MHLAHPLKICTGCRNVRYCTQECQKGDRRIHRLVCGDKAGIPQLLNKQYHERGEKKPDPTRILSTEPTAKDPSSSGSDLNDILNWNFLHDMPEKEAFIFLIDSYRLRQEDEYQRTGEVECDSIYDGAETSLPGFQDFLDLAQTREGVLPPWWNQDKRAACEHLGCTKGSWEYLGRAIESSDVFEHYGNIITSLKLRVLAEKIYERGVADDIFDSGKYGKAPWED